MAFESYAFPEGTMWLWTGSNPSSAIAFVQDVSVSMTKGVNNLQAVNGNYHNIVTGYRADVTFSVVYVNDMSLYKLFNSPTAVHMKLDHNHALGSAGVILYSGIFDSMAINGQENQVYSTPMVYHANVWSGYG